MINKTKLFDSTITFRFLVDLGNVAHSANFTYNTLPHNQGFEF